MLRTSLAILTMLIAGCATTDAKFTSGKTDNAYFPLTPGTVYTYTEKHGTKTSDNIVTVTSDTKMVDGKKCVVVHDVLKHDGRITEDTLDYYAQDDAGNVWYYGEATREISKDGKESTEGSWEAGVNGAQAGTMMPAHPKPGAPYRQEYLKGEAEDMGQIIAVDETVTVPAGTYTHCVKTKDWSMLEKGHEYKWYAKGVGFVRSESSGGEVVELVSVKHGTSR